MLESAQPLPPSQGEPGRTAPASAAPPASSEPLIGLSLRSRAARGTLINTAFMLGLGGLGLLESFIVARFVSRADYGVWGVLIVTLTTLLWLKQVGIGDKYVQQDARDQELAFQNAFTLELGFTVALLVVFAVVVPIVAVIYGLPQLLLPGAVLAVTLLASAFQAPQWIYYRRMNFARQQALAAVNPVVGFVVAVGLAVAGAGYWAFVGGLAAGTCAAALFAVIQSPYKLRLHYEPGTMRSYASFSVPLIAASAASFVMTWSAFIATKLDLGIAAVGVIALSATVVSFTDNADQLVTGALYPAICAVKDRTSLLYEALVKSNRLALMWAVPFGIGLSLFASDLVRYGIGERWRAAVIVLQIYGVTAAVNHIGFNWTAYFRARGTTRPIALASFASMALFLAGGIPLLLAFGLPGFAAGIALQGLGAFVIRVFYLKRMFHQLAFLRHMARSFLPTLPAAAAVLGARMLEPHGRSLGLAIAELGAYVLITAMATWLLESELIREALGALRGRNPVPQVSNL